MKERAAVVLIYIWRAPGWAVFGAHLIQLTDGAGAAGQLVWEAQLHRHLCHRVKEKTRKCPSDSHQLFPLTHIVRSV